MIRWAIVVVAVYGICCALALGQSGYARPGDGAPALAPRPAGQPVKIRLSAASMTNVPRQEPRLVKKHDLLTVIIREESEISTAGTTDLKKDASLDARIDEFPKINLAELQVQGGGLETTPSIKLSGNRQMKGDATEARSDSFTGRLQAEVVDVKPNGTLVLQARKTIKTDDDVQEFVLSGTCRVDDITADNTVLSTQIYDQQLQKNHRGPVRDTTKRGWLTKLLDALNPF